MDFATQYQSLVKDVFIEYVRNALADGADASEQARHYIERGKPDFVLAYLLACDLPDDEKQESLAQSYERRATLTEERARDFDRKFHREFPQLHTSAANDRAAARQIRAGKAPRPGVGRQLPMR